MKVELRKTGKAYENSFDLNLKGITAGKLIALKEILDAAKPDTTLEVEIVSILRVNLSRELAKIDELLGS